MSEKMSVKKAEEFSTSNWSGGTTTQLYIYPEDGNYAERNFQARISSATVDVVKSEFTSLPNVKRYLMIFEGHLDLIHGVNTRVELEPYQVDEFDGGIPTVSYGKVVDFNLMLKDGADGVMETVQLKTAQQAVIEREKDYNLLCIYVKEGSMKIANQQVSSGELAVIEDWEHPVELKNEAEATAKAGICKVKTV